MIRDYREKRDFKFTPEPVGNQEYSGDGPLSFVIQKHSARQLHYDFRLELDGVLKSWAISKGPSYDPKTKRLAVMVEDHPLDYSSFEGIIPQGQYGAGQVIVWDRGTYSPDEGGELSFNDRLQAEERIREGLARGKISILLRGEKLKGSWTLVRMQHSDKNWLLIKHQDEHAAPDRDILSEEASVLSGLTINVLKSGRSSSHGSLAIGPAGVAGAIKESFPKKIPPMLASLAGDTFSDEQWLFEPKLDGFRMLAFINNGKVRLQSRRGLDVTEHYLSLSKSLEKQPVTQLILDGEVIALDSRGRLCFQCLQGYLESIQGIKDNRIEMPGAIIYYIFDILYLDGYDLRRVSLQQRKKLLQSTVAPDQKIRFVEYFTVDGQTVYRAAIQNGLEGIVAKRLDSIYESGKRSHNWLKIKQIKSDDFVIAGFTRGKGNRGKTFGALLLGYYDSGNFVYAGNVGSGFNEETLSKLKNKLDTIAVRESPFSIKPANNKDITWVKPELVAEIKYSEWTRDWRLRAPVFLRLRDDKPATATGPAKVFGNGVGFQGETPAGRFDNLKEVLEQLSSPKANYVIEVEGHKLSLSNLDKELWPETGETRALNKRDLIIYLARVSPYLLPHLKNRPLSLSRYPEGIYGKHFFQKHYQPVPRFVDTVALSSHDTPPRDYLLCNNMATLLWLGQIANIELHSWFSRVKPGPDFKGDTDREEDFYTGYPDFIVLDIDPYIYSGKEAVGAEPELNRTAFRKTCEIALKLKEVLDNMSLPGFVKTSGRTGLHIFIPVLRQMDFHGTRAAAETLSRFLVQQHPKEVTMDWPVEKRRGKIFMDYNQNVRGKTLASVYSPRPVSGANISLPLRWDELDNIYPTDFTILNTPERLAETGDIWVDILDAGVDLMELLSKVKPR